MNADNILQILTKNINEIIGTSISSVAPEMSLREIGANSVDRADILMQTMADLNVKLSMVEFAAAKNLGDIAAIFQKHSTSATQ